MAHLHAMDAVAESLDAPLPALVAGAAAELASICRRFNVRRLDLFGSAAVGQFDPDRSDLDFVVEFEDQPKPGYFRIYMGFRRALTDLFGRDIDLLTEASIVNPYLREQIETQRRRLFPQG